ncbi:hypothetical protein [Paenibacillus thalictri]|uniref:Uncharacterized protein n=1 Tax=Paenibacillus thalictri TaxID=2527873 RepID=A0A4Q9DXM9_9BACL|nr:hypothetical protein [Paenibacillus thalictri]TBL80613.1 hypothetical protein EYB31_05125 [Paenibacillus thalictri]
MNIAELLEYWKDTKTMVELHFIEAGRKRKAHGRIFSFDFQEQYILFYNDDTKNIENISLTQIEDAIAAEPPKSEPVAPVEPVIKEEAASVQQTKGTKKNLTVKEEIVEIVDSMSTGDLYALLPLFKHLARNQQKRLPGE